MLSLVVMRRTPFVLASAQRVNVNVSPLVAQQHSIAALTRWTQPWTANRASSSSSGSTRWKQRQGRDMYAREAKVQGLKSRAAFKLLAMDAKYRLFRPGQTVVDLVAMERTRPHGRVVGIDLIPAQPPRGVATFQGDFLSPQVQALVRDFILRTHKPRSGPPPKRKPAEDGDGRSSSSDVGEVSDAAAAGEALAQPSYIDQERHMGEVPEANSDATLAKSSGMAIVDVVLSDMSEPWPQTNGYTTNTLSNPYHRLMNTSGNAFRDHAGSMDLCNAALQFASDTLRPGGHFLCKFYQGAEDKKLEKRLKGLFAKVHREKPESSRSESKEAYFIALRRKHGVVVEEEE
ncbi:2' O-ribose methyltransferase [Purpureocillium lilacinum]|nr:2' O-ribose methyltransferase [Purpureocillium lilacinum]